MAGTPDGDVWTDIAPPEDRALTDAHRQILEVESQIDPEVIEARGYHSLTRTQVTELVNLEVLSSTALSADGWLAIPIYRPDGIKHGEQIRLFGTGLRQKYLWPSGFRLSFDVHPDDLVKLLDPTIPVLFTEGVKKGDALLSAARREGYACAVVTVAGCDGWKIRHLDGSIASPDFLDIVWQDRRVFVISDSDYRSNDSVARGWTECARYLEGKTGAHRTFLVIVPPDGMTKQGADDYLAGGGSLDSLLGLAQSPRYAATEDPPEERPLRVRTGSHLMATRAPKIPYLMAPLIPAKSITLMAGHSGTLKTWAALALALDGALGLPWLDHPELQPDLGAFATLYVNKEMQEEIVVDRLVKYGANDRYKHHPDIDHALDTRFFLVSEAALDLNVERQRDRLEDAIIAYKVGLVVLDSLSMSWHGDENSASEVGAFYAHLRGITERTGCAWILIHHLLKTGKASKGDPMTVAIRGSGQLSQQADVALMLANYAIEGDDQMSRLVSMAHAKARTDRELVTWLTRFSVTDGIFASYQYLSTLADAKARVASDAPADSARIREWILEELKAMPVMRHVSSGLRFQSVLALLQANWNVDGKSPPSESTIRRQIRLLVDEGILHVLETSRGKGDLLRLPDPEEEKPDERSSHPAQPAHGTTVPPEPEADAPEGEPDPPAPLHVSSRRRGS